MTDPKDNSASQSENAGTVAGIDGEAKTLLSELSHESEDLVPIFKDEILPGLPLPTDIFVRLSSGHFVLIAKKGTKSTLAELHVAQSHEVESFYIRREDYYVAVDQNLKIAGILARQKDIPIPRRSGFIRAAADSVFKEIGHLGINKTSLAHAKQTVTSITTLVQSRDDYFQLVSAMREMDGSLIKEALATSALAVLIGQELGWKNKVNLEKLALGALLRDIGLKEIPKEIVDRKRVDMTSEERAIWETHAFRGAEILAKLGDVPTEVISIVMEHHENAIGQGFPRRIRDAKMNPFAKVVSLADSFVHLTITASYKDKVMTPEQALFHIEFSLGSPFNRACMVALKRALNLEGQTGDHPQVVSDKEIIPVKGGTNLTPATENESSPPATTHLSEATSSELLEPEDDRPFAGLKRTGSE